MIVLSASNLTKAYGTDVIIKDADFHINSGDRIAQVVVCRFEQVRLEPVEELDSTERGSGGFGHTGV